MKVIIKTATPIIAIIGIILLEFKALSLGFNGTLLAMTFAIIGGLGGYETKAIKDLIKKVK